MESMNALPDMTDLMVTIFYLGCGLYCLVTGLQFRKKEKLAENRILLPSGCEPRKCKDPKGFLQYILPRCTALGICLILFGGLLAVDHFLFPDQLILTLALIVLPLAALAWYVYALKMAAKSFW